METLQDSCQLPSLLPSSPPPPPPTPTPPPHVPPTPASTLPPPFHAPPSLHDSCMIHGAAPRFRRGAITQFRNREVQTRREVSGLLTPTRTPPRIPIVPILVLFGHLSCCQRLFEDFTPPTHDVVDLFRRPCPRAVFGSLCGADFLEKQIRNDTGAEQRVCGTDKRGIVRGIRTTRCDPTTSQLVAILLASQLVAILLARCHPTSQLVAILRPNSSLPSSPHWT